MTADSKPTEIDEHLESLALVDHHCHSVFATGAGAVDLELVITESGRRFPGGSHFDSQAGFALMRWCAPVLDLDAHATPEAYLERRGALGDDRVNRLFLGGCRVGRYVVDTGFPSEGVVSLETMAEAGRASCDEIVRLEQVADAVAGAGVGGSEFADAFAAELEKRLAAGVVGTKSVAAYRHGLDLDPERPQPDEVSRAAGRWLAEIEKTGVVRVSDPVLLRHLLWAGVDARVPMQVHTGLGDGDLDLLRCNPLHLTGFLRATEKLGTPIMLLHCYPYHREAAYLAHIFPNVYFDVGLAVNLLGAQSGQVVAEALELAPFAKQVYSSDGWGAPELHFLGARLWRDAMSAVLNARVRDGHWSTAQAARVATMIGAANAERLYGS